MGEQSMIGLSLAFILVLTNALNVCEYSQARFHVILDKSDITKHNGRVVCQSQGWQYANVSSLEWEMAAETIGNCTSLSVGIESYNGMSITGNECQYMQASGVFSLGMTPFQCNQTGMLPLLCREPELSSTTVVPINLKAIPKKSIIQHVVKQEDFTVCEHSKDGLHLLFGPYEHGEAKVTCATYGWTLATLDTTNLDALDYMWTSCDPMDATAWVDSMNATKTGLCRNVYKQGPGIFWYMVSEGDHPCSMGTGMILCQDFSSPNTKM